MFKKDLDEMRAYARSHGLTLTALVRAMFHRIVQDKFQSAPPVLPE